MTSVCECRDPVVLGVALFVGMFDPFFDEFVNDWKVFVEIPILFASERVSREKSGNGCFGEEFVESMHRLFDSDVLVDFGQRVKGFSNV